MAARIHNYSSGGPAIEPILTIRIPMLVIPGWSQSVSLAYATPLLNAIVRVMNAVFGRYALLDQLRPANRSQTLLDDSHSMEDAHRIYLKHCDHFLGSGLENLAAHVRAATEKALEAFSVQTPCGELEFAQVSVTFQKRTRHIIIFMQLLISLPFFF